MNSSGCGPNSPKSKLGSDDADDDVRFAAELDRLARGSARSALKRRTHSAWLIRTTCAWSGPVFRGGERTALDDRRAEEPEVLGRHLLGAQLLRQPGAGEVDDVGPVRRDVLRRRRPARRQWVNLAGERAEKAALGRGRLEDDHAIRVRDTPTGLSSTALTMEKMAVLAPMPSASAPTAARVKPGLLRKARMACLASASRSAKDTSSECGGRHAPPWNFRREPVSNSSWIRETVYCGGCRHARIPQA